MTRRWLPLPFFLAACSSTADPSPLPGWHGTWTGTLLYGPPGAAVGATPMEIRFGPVKDHPERVSFTLVYGSGAQQDVRPYELVATDLANGRVQIDEKNSIVLDATLREDTLVSSFVVGGQLTTCRYALRGPWIEFSCESIDVDLAKGTTTGGRVSAPVVTLPRVVAVQQARLYNPERVPPREHWLWYPRASPFWHGPR